LSVAETDALNELTTGDGIIGGTTFTLRSSVPKLMENAPTTNVTGIDASGAEPGVFIAALTA